MDDFANLIDALRKFITEVGVGWTLLMIAVALAAAWLWAYIQEKSLKEAFLGTIDEKEKQIQRLAADNREWRNYFFRMDGLSEAEIKKLSAPTPGDEPVPIGSDKMPVAHRKRKKRGRR